MPLREHAFLYVDCDVPAGVTLDAWRAERALPPRRRVRVATPWRKLVRPVHDSARTRE
jgi:hypothetical protein